MMHKCPHLDGGTLQANLDKLYQVVELQIAQAIKDIKERKRTNLAAAARTHRVPLFHLWYRWKGRQSCSDYPIYSHNLLLAEEKELCIYLDRLKIVGMLATLPLIALKVNSILACHHNTPKVL
jgi:hypothetical protein